MKKGSNSNHLLSVEIRQSWKKEQVTHHDVPEHSPVRPDTSQTERLAQPAQETRENKRQNTDKGNSRQACTPQAKGLSKMQTFSGVREVVNFHTQLRETPVEMPKKVRIVHSKKARENLLGLELLTLRFTMCCFFFKWNFLFCYYSAVTYKIAPSPL